MRQIYMISLLWLTLPATADTTYVQAGSVSGVWTRANSPFMIEGTINISNDQQLIIEPGVEVNFYRGSRLIVDGPLLALGAPGDSIKLWRNPSDSTHRWLGINFVAGGAGSSLNYCLISGAGISNTPVMTVTQILVRLSHSTLVNRNQRNIVVNANSQIIIDHCYIVGGRAAYGSPGPCLYLHANAEAEVTNTFFGHSGGLDAGAIQVNDNSLLVMDRCTFKNNHAAIWGGAIFGDNSSILATRCTFWGNWALQGGHLRILSMEFASFNSCIFANWRQSGAFDYSGTPIELQNCLFFGTPPIFSSGQGPTGFNNRDYVNSNGTPCDIYANIFVDPELADTSQDILSLVAQSPCINAGDSALPPDLDGTTSDIGATPFLNFTSSLDRTGLGGGLAQYPAQPNPFNPVTTLTFDLPETAIATLKIFDLTGREVTTLINESLPAGTHSITWNAASNPSGTYFAILESNKSTSTQKLLLLK